MSIKCCCIGKVHDRWHNWRRLDASESVGSITLYCLDCRQQWVSSAKYAVLPGIHKPRKRSGMTDQDILDLVLTGDLLVNTWRAKVWKKGRTGEYEPLQIITRTHRDGPQRGTYRFVSVCRDGKKKKIALHRLVWMAHAKRIVPPQCDIDHRYSQDDDTIGNLRLLTSSENRSLGAKSRTSSEASF